jgi:hypothetical protein
VAKRAVEQRLLNTPAVRPVILRPSLIWTWDRPQALPSVVPFYVASTLRIPYIDRPIQVEVLVDAALSAIADGSTSGVQRFGEMDRLAERLR